MLHNCFSCLGILGVSAIKIGLSASTICNSEQGASGLRSQCLGAGGEDSRHQIGMSTSIICDLEQRANGLHSHTLRVSGDDSVDITIGLSAGTVRDLEQRANDSE